MSDQHSIDESGILRRGKAPVSGVSVPGRIGVGTDLVQTLDYVVMLQLLFDIAEGATPTPLKVWEELKLRGIRSSKNVNELVGKNAVYESFSRLMTAGYVRRIEIPNQRPGRRPTIGYEVYDNPSWNPDWQAGQVGSDPLEPSVRQIGSVEKPQVSPLPGTPEVVFGEVGETAGQPTSRNAGSGVRGSGVPGSGKRRVPAGQSTSGVPGSGRPSPPHPPEGGGTPPPKPPTTGRAGKWAAACALEPGDYIPTTAEVRAADAFLQDLPGKWQCGPQKARELAPLLASRVQTQRYELDDLLALVLTQDNPNRPANAPVSTLPYRIRDLKRFRADEPTLPGPASGGPGVVPWCGVCNRGEKPTSAAQRFREIPGGKADEPCPECHPKRARNRSRA
ncbi:hypothetical protein QMK19_36385 [Streptomyces sp. H10-C2]|uniref:hypothetical protein n=1 Tax=unclassified Streptomyces TaxID=2593676 RepID=UPI0024BB346C|nr:MULTISPECIES: hypothetical protein [unclassified Streptomyces]MDJ0346358.1 hypothetical protein [Streptomyces sp. PH10-H1]MDJ0374952.1 hypothetical protein [Streptomyces sp. H10-C2]